MLIKFCRLFLCNEFISAFLNSININKYTISEKHVAYAEKIKDKLALAGIRAKVDTSNEKFGKKLRNSIQNKIPYSIIVGDSELNEQKITVRARKTEKQQSMPLEEFIAKLEEEIKSKTIEPQVIV